MSTWSPALLSALLLAIALGAFLLCALAPYKAVSKLVGRPLLATLVGVLALFALAYHISGHFIEYAQELFPGAGALQYLITLAPFLLIAVVGYAIENLYHSHEDDDEHASHAHSHGAKAQVSGIMRMIVLSVHAFLDGHIIATLGLSWLTLPFIFHKAVDGLVVNSERACHKAASAWRGRIVIQLFATTCGAFLHFEGVPEAVHIGLVSAVVGLYAGSLTEYVRYRHMLHHSEEQEESLA
ncbi:MAG TPA: hypothetical protein VLA04_05665 [Verrucomicrobiae bacterium]|nr:hypothetical protein [Verrucomicrobiae bacterium]